MRYKGIGFNDKWAVSVTWDEFYKETSQNLFTQYSKKDQEKDLKQAYIDCHTANGMKPTFPAPKKKEEE